MPLPDGMKRHVIDGHSHIGEIEAWPFYGIDYPVKPIVYDFPQARRTSSSSWTSTASSAAW